MSALGTILSNVKTRIETLSGEPTVSLRKRIALREGDSLPLVVVAPLDETVVDQGFGESVTYEYRVGVALITAGNQIYDDDLLTYLDTREAIRDVLFSHTYAGFDVQLDSTRPYDLAALDTGYDAGLIVLKVRSAEDRN